MPHPDWPLRLSFYRWTVECSASGGKKGAQSQTHNHNKAKNVHSRVVMTVRVESELILRAY